MSSTNLSTFINARKSDPFYTKYRDTLEYYWYSLAPDVSYRKKRQILIDSVLFQKTPMEDARFRLKEIELKFKEAQAQREKEMDKEADDFMADYVPKNSQPLPPPKEDSSDAPLTPQTVIYLFDGRAIPLDYEQDQKLREKTEAEFRKLGITDLSRVPIETRRQIEQNVYSELLDLEIERNTQKRKKRRGIAKTQGGDFSQIANDAATRYLISQAKSFSSSKTPYDVWLEEHFKGGGTADPFLL